MIGLRTGLRTGLRMGLATGIGADEIGADTGGGAVTWTVDATSGIAVPSTSAEWASFIAAKGLSVAVPDALWLMQEGSGDFADSTSGGLILTATGTISYQQAVSGWTRNGFATSDGVSGGARTTAAGLPDMSTAALTTLFLASVASSGGTRSIYESGPSAGSRIGVLAANQVRAFDGANNATGTADPRGVVRPFVNKFDPVNSADVVYTDQEKISPLFAALSSSKALTIGGTSATPPTATYVYAASWFGAHAQMTDANLKALLQAMGFVITWS